MAKGKHAAALFEVIQSTRFQRNRPDPLITPRWWFKRQPKLQLSPASLQSVSGATLPAPDSAPAAKAVIDPPVHSAPKRPIPGVDFELDPDRHQISFKLSYNTAIIAAFTVVVVVGLAYLIGQKMHRAPVATTDSPSTVELRSKPAHADVLDVANLGARGGDTHGGDTHGGQLLSTKVSENDAQQASLKLLGRSSPDDATNPPSPSNTQRVIGRQYVVIQSYTDEKAADEIAGLLARSNVPCSVIKALPNWGRADMYSIVGTTGFDRLRGNVDYEHYQANITRVGEQLAANGKFKRFEPHAYRWKGTTG